MITERRERGRGGEGGGGEREEEEREEEEREEEIPTRGQAPTRKQKLSTLTKWWRWNWKKVQQALFTVFV